MMGAVLVVFSGTQVREELFERALAEARRRSTRLILLDVRHLQQADRLGDYLATESLLGPGAVASLRRSVKQQRDRAIERALGALKQRATREAVEVESLEVQGTFAEAVKTIAREKEATVVVLEDKPEGAAIGGPFEVIRV